MNKNKNIVYIALSAMGVIGLVFLIFWTNDSGSSYHWRRTYNPEQKNPYDTYLIYNLLKSGRDSGEFKLSQTAFRNVEWRNEKMNYVFFGDQTYYSGEDIDSLLAFVKYGNNAFIAEEYLNTELLHRIIEVDSSSDYVLSLVEKSVKACVEQSQCYTFEIEKTAETLDSYYWSYYDLPESETLSSYGNLNGEYSHFLKITYGDGNFYFHANPLMFTNYFMVDSATWNYANAVFKSFSPTTFYWEKHADLNISDLYSDQFQNPLKHILGNPSFLWAWYIMLALIGLFLLLNSKRKQKNIPFLEPNENSTIEFTETIGQLYFRENNHYKIAGLMMKLFLFNLYVKYRIPVHKERDKATLAKLAIKSGADPGLFSDIVAKYNLFTGISFAGTSDLMDFYKMIVAYNNSCK